MGAACGQEEVKSSGSPPPVDPPKPKPQPKPATPPKEEPTPPPADDTKNEKTKRQSSDSDKKGSDAGGEKKVDKTREKMLARANKLAAKNQVFSTLRVCKGVEAVDMEVSEEQQKIHELAAKAAEDKKAKIKKRKTKLEGKTVYTFITEEEDRKTQVSEMEDDKGQVYDTTNVRSTSLPLGLCPIRNLTQCVCAQVSHQVLMKVADFVCGLKPPQAEARCF